ncbi:MAG: hypothetical protein K2Y39_13010 [Candidatus Obscuribacterales bacterium]|nr:hypothetical protein [Candidatus Obscuribacterales bacterium]
MLISALLQMLACSLRMPCYSMDEIAAINKRILAKPKNSDVYFERAAEKLKYLDYEGCVENVTRSIELKPTADKYFIRAVARRETGKLLDAEMDFEKSAQLSPRSENAYAELACLAAKLRHYDKANRAFEQLFKLSPVRFVERSRRAEMYLQMKKPQAALNDVETCLKIDSDAGGRCHTILGLACVQLRQYERAVDAFNFAIKKNEFNIDARKGRLEAYEKLGNKKMAQQERRALEEEFSEAFNLAPFRSK